VRKEYTDYIWRIKAVAHKYGDAVGKHIDEVLQNNAFLHTGVVMADNEAAEWATTKGTEGNPCTEHPDYLKILSGRNTMWVIRNGRHYIAVFTDGSACCTASEWLSHGGWGVFTPGAEHNTAGHLQGVPCTSYRAEGRAILDAVTRAGEPICIICDNQAAVNNLRSIVANLGEVKTWRDNDECADFWQTIADHIRRNKHLCPIAEWMPSHMDDPKKAQTLQEFIANGGSQEWVEGNKQADKLAEQGARSQAPPAHLVHREKLKVLITRAVQRMLVHIWAVFREYVPDHEAELQPYVADDVFGLDDPWAENWDPHEPYVPEEAWLDGLYDCEHEDNYDSAPCDFDNPEAWNEPDAVTEHPDRTQTDPPEAVRGNAGTDRCEYTRGGKQNIDGPSDALATEVAGGMGLPPDELPSETSKVPEVCAGSSGGGTQAAAAVTTNDDAAAEETNATQRLAAARKKFCTKGSAHYPPAQGSNVGLKYHLLEEFKEGAIFRRIKLGKVSVAKKDAKNLKFSFKREWYQPLAWVLDNLEWSPMYFPADKAPEKRKNTVSYVELACIADVLTGGAIGPRRATFAERAAIIKEGIARLTKKTKVADDSSGNQVESEKFIYQLPNVSSASSTGFTALPGLSRRPVLAKFPGLHTAVGALLTYARNEEKVLDAVMPRYLWLRPSWKEDSLLTT
jgi:ribonuclease HI